MCCLQSDMGPSLWQKHQDRNRAWLFSQSSNWTSPRKRTCYMQEKLLGRRRWRTWRLLSGFTNKENMRWTVSYKLKSCFCLLLDQINVHDYCLNTALGSRGGPRCRPSVIRGLHSGRVCRAGWMCSLSAEAIPPSLCSSDTYRKPSLFPRIEFQAKIKSFNTFVREVKDSSLCGSAWTDASNAVLLTYLCEPATGFHSPTTQRSEL